MKIENNGIHPLNTPRPTSASPASRASHAVPRPEQDEAQIHEDARLLAKARQQLNQQPEAQAARLEALQKQIESGDYTIALGDLARKLAAQYYSG